jgi:hypothetical protein
MVILLFKNAKARQRLAPAGFSILVLLCCYNPGEQKFAGTLVT